MHRCGYTTFFFSSWWALSLITFSFYQKEIKLSTGNKVLSHCNYEWLSEVIYNLVFNVILQFISNNKRHSLLLLGGNWEEDEAERRGFTFPGHQWLMRDQAALCFQEKWLNIPGG